MYVAVSEKPVALDGTVTTVPFALPEGEKVQRNDASAVLPWEPLASPLLALPARTWSVVPSKPTIETAGGRTVSPGETHGGTPSPLTLCVWSPT